MHTDHVRVGCGLQLLLESKVLLGRLAKHAGTWEGKEASINSLTGNPPREGNCF